MKNALGSWMTTLMGLITGAALGYVGYSTGNPALIVAGLGAAGFGTAAKDRNVTGGTVAIAQLLPAPVTAVVDQAVDAAPAPLSLVAQVQAMQAQHQSNAETIAAILPVLASMAPPQVTTVTGPIGATGPMGPIGPACPA